MTKLLKITSLFIIIVGVVGVGLNTILGVGSISYIDSYKVGTLTLYKINALNYLDNLKITIGNPQTLILQIPDFTWTNDIGTNLKLIANLLIFPVNILLYPIKISSYVSKSLLAVIGIDFINPTNTTIWLVNLVNELSALQIPFIQ